ncbi:ATP-binding protein [Pseudonocardia broussonetiae]|uniref:AAA family ATPase n=1 Tax=Pseudonocardia broussonetiae TaxID=2736640 RepID=A0A6M6JLW0_9PSEU|nr:LuxR family transcriptional regulator [Pseudonocardia broussonetiae]QJY47917.1 AAA family ATPase [Pseudonocardia broussonetiae]
MAGGELLGRDREMTLLDGWLAEAHAGQRRLVLCSGEPGVGKTRLAEEFATRASERGALALWGRASEADGAPPFWLWRQVLRAASRVADAQRIAGELQVATDLAVVAPEVFPAEAGRARSGGAEQRFQVFDAVSRFVRAVAAERGLVVVLDDLHWADRPSLLLLRHLVGDPEPARLLVLGTFRDTEMERAAAVAELIREPAAVRVDLRGLTIDDVARQLAAATGAAVAPELVERVHELTAGNPFFVSELARTLGTWRIPDSVREAITRRMDALTPRCRHQLRAAAIVGREFSIAVVAAVIGRLVLRCLDPLDEAVRAGLVEPAGVPGQHRFVHALVRDAVEAGLPERDRIRMHRAAAEAVEAFHAGALEEHLADLARHWAAAAVGDRAARWAELAAAEAMRRLAYEEAARLYRLALDVSSTDLPDAERFGLLLSLARALQQSADPVRTRETVRLAVEVAIRMGRSDLAAEAALLPEVTGVPDVDQALRTLCENALASLGKGRPDPTRVRLLARLADAAMATGDMHAAAAASRAAIDEANRCGDPAATVAALHARHLIRSGPEQLAERVDLADQLLAIAGDSGDAALRATAHEWRIDICFAHGDLAGVAAELERFRWWSERSGGPLTRWMLWRYEAALAQAQGRFTEARSCADAAFAAVAALRYPAAVPVRHALLNAVDHHTGVDPRAPHIVEMLAAGPGDPATPGHGFQIMNLLAPAALLATAGHLDAARAKFRAAGPAGTWRTPPFFALNFYAVGVRIAIRVGADDEVAALRGLLDPHRGRHVVSGNAVAYYGGPVELYLGQAARHLGRLDDAVGDLENALQVARDSGARGYAVEAAHGLAAALTRRGRPDDHRKSRAVAREWHGDALVLGMEPFQRDLAEWGATWDTGAAGLTRREDEVAGCVARGLTNREIAAALFISERTAENHVQHILTKLGFANRSQIAAWVAARGNMSTATE